MSEASLIGVPANVRAGMDARAARVSEEAFAEALAAELPGHPCGSLSPPDKMRLGQLDRLSRDWLRKACDAKPDERGPDTDLFAKCETHWRRVRNHRFPHDSTEREKLLEAERLAWWAMWYAYDFTIDAILGRYPLNQRYNIGQAIGPNVIVHGEGYPATHIPQVDRDGNATNVAETATRSSQILNRIHNRRTYLVGLVTGEDAVLATARNNASDHEIDLLCITEPMASVGPCRRAKPARRSTPARQGGCHDWGIRAADRKAAPDPTRNA